MKEFFRKNLNVPNTLSFIRLLLVPVYVLLFFDGKVTAALIVFIVASITDCLDGHIARKYHLITDVGKLLDPLADKLLVVSSMFCLAIGSPAQAAVFPWAAVIILLAKELMMILGGLYLLKRGVVVASVMAGKVAHCVCLAAIIAGHFHAFWLKVCAGWPLPLDVLLVWLAVAMTLYALGVYATNAVKVLKSGGKWE